ncbi:hypothetical protein LCGC14_1179040, partial [marine sediment metagenome]
DCLSCRTPGRVLDASLLEKADCTPQPERLLGVLWKIIIPYVRVYDDQYSNKGVDLWGPYTKADPRALIAAVQVLVEVAK